MPTFDDDGNYTPAPKELHQALVAMCQTAGFTTERTYTLLRQVIASIQLNEPEPLVFTLTIDGTIASLIDPEEPDDMPIAEAEGATPDEAVRNLMDKVTFDEDGAEGHLRRGNRRTQSSGLLHRPRSRDLRTALIEVRNNPLLADIRTTTTEA